MGKSGEEWVNYLQNTKISKRKVGVLKMLFGEYSHSLDTKGRLAIPAKLREGLGDKIVITKGLDGCLFVYDMEEWKKLEDKLAAMPMTRKNSRDFVRFLFSGACESELDKQGRVSLPVNLRLHASLERDCVIIGVGKRAEIWDAAKWLAYNETSAEDVNALAEELADLGI